MSISGIGPMSQRDLQHSGPYDSDGPAVREAERHEAAAESGAVRVAREVTSVLDRVTNNARHRLYHWSCADVDSEVAEGDAPIVEGSLRFRLAADGGELFELGQMLVTLGKYLNHAAQLPVLPKITIGRKPESLSPFVQSLTTAKTEIDAAVQCGINAIAVNRPDLAEQCKKILLDGIEGQRAIERAGKDGAA